MATHESNVEQQTPPTESALVRERYDRTARHYDVMTWPMEVMAMDRYRSRLIAEVEGAHVLEVGVGTGRNLSLYPDAVQVDAIQSVRDWQVVFGRYGQQLEARPLELGRSDGRVVEVLGGLRAGERYAARNSFVIKAELGKAGASHDH